MDSDREVQALLPSPDEVQQAQGTVGRGRQWAVTGLSWPSISVSGGVGTQDDSTGVRSKRDKWGAGVNVRCPEEPGG